MQRSFHAGSPSGGVSERPPKDSPMGVMDSFGPLSTPSIFHGYVYANSVIEATTGFITTSGSKGTDEQVMEEACNAFRAEMRPWIGEVAVIRTDYARQTSVSQRWQRHKNSDPPFISQNATGHKHYPIGLIERVHKEAWPRPSLAAPASSARTTCASPAHRPSAAVW